MVQFLVFGDSLTYGAWDEHGGWTQRLRTFIDKKYPEEHFVYNLGVAKGDTSKDILERMKDEIKSRTEGNCIIIIQIGTNDSAIMSTKKNFWITPNKFEKNIESIIIISKKFSKKILFVGEVPVDESKTHPVPWDKRVTYMNENIMKYNEMLRKVCKKNKIPFIEFFEKWIKSDYKRFLQDGVHPNSEGHKKIFETVKDYLTENKII
jgi:lysophospholipase L1-like esterase